MHDPESLDAMKRKTSEQNMYLDANMFLDQGLRRHAPCEEAMFSSNIVTKSLFRT